MEIKVLGSGCPSCIKLEKNVHIALKILKKEANVVKITEFEEIASYNIMSTPGLVVDGIVLSSGKVLSPKKLSELLK